MELFGFMFGTTIAMLALTAVIAALLAPVFWVWMLIDSIVRESWEYPDGTSNAKLVWVLLIAFVHVTALFYFFMVYRKVARGSVPRPAWQAPTAPPAAPSAA